MMNISNDLRKAEEYFANKNSFTTGPVEVSRNIENGDNIVIIDVRAEEDFRQGHVPGAVNLPEGQWQTLLGPGQTHLKFGRGKICLVLLNSVFR